MDDGRKKQKGSTQDEDMREEDQDFQGGAFQGKKGGQTRDNTTELEDLSEEDSVINDEE